MDFKYGLFGLNKRCFADVDEQILIHKELGFRMSPIYYDAEAEAILEWSKKKVMRGEAEFYDGYGRGRKLESLNVPKTSSRKRSMRGGSRKG